MALLALVLGQWSVLAHAVWHAPGAAGAASVVADADGDHLWGHQAGTHGCHLVDHLLVGQATGAEPPAVFATAAAAVPAQAVAAVPMPGASTWAYAARGPPAA